MSPEEDQTVQISIDAPSGTDAPAGPSELQAQLAGPRVGSEVVHPRGALHLAEALSTASDRISAADRLSSSDTKNSTAVARRNEIIGLSTDPGPSSSSGTSGHGLPRQTIVSTVTRPVSTRQQVLVILHSQRVDVV